LGLRVLIVLLGDLVFALAHHTAGIGSTVISAGDDDVHAGSGRDRLEVLDRPRRPPSDGCVDDAGQAVLLRRHQLVDNEIEIFFFRGRPAPRRGLPGGLLFP
jgi:hypothetical protein